MNRRFFSYLLGSALFASGTAGLSQSKTPRKQTTAAAQWMRLAQQGHCRRALPHIQALLPAQASPTGRDLALAGVQCALSLQNNPAVLHFLGWLGEKFPKDPEVLYVSVHAYSDLSTRASLELLYKDPSAYQVHELNAEALEAQGKWDKAAAEYRTILAQHPHLAGIHYRLGRLLLSKPGLNAAGMQEARKEFEAELAIDPKNAAAHFVLGEIAVQTGSTAAGVSQFRQAVALDHDFTQAYLELGKALMQLQQPAQAVAPLREAVRLEPKDSTAHYQLAVALSRTGQSAAAARQRMIYQKLKVQQRQQQESVRRQVTGG